MDPLLGSKGQRASGWLTRSAMAVVTRLRGGFFVVVVVKLIGWAATAPSLTGPAPMLMTNPPIMLTKAHVQ